MGLIKNKDDFMSLLSLGIRKEIERFLEEDDLGRNAFYLQSLSREMVKCELKIKSPMRLAGLPFFVEVFRLLEGKPEVLEDIFQYEGRDYRELEVISFELPFATALTGERLALNLLQRASMVATHTKRFVDKCGNYPVKILDTRKTTPGLRTLEKYAVRIGGGFNHRFGQADMWMVKDNHKKILGGVKGAVEFFKSQGLFYNNIEVEVHTIHELKEALELGVKHVMLDNFSVAQITEAAKLKTTEVTFEVSGGVNLDNIQNYLVNGVDAISIGALTYGAPSVDLSLKFEKKS